MADTDIRTHFLDPDSNESLIWTDDGLANSEGTIRVPMRDGIPRFVDDRTHQNFEIQWKRFSQVQLDSVNGTTQSYDRLFEQSGLTAADFEGKTILEVGCGAGRFTEIFLALGARTVSLDYSGAVEANARTHADAVADGRAAFAQGDIFRLPVADQSFDMVFCYGVVQHTGDASKAIRCLWEKVKPGGMLLVDRYRISLQNAMPVKYILRPITKHIPADTLLSAVDRYVRTVFPLQARVFGALQGGGAARLARLVANRWTLNSVFPVNLYVRGELDRDVALAWSILDTFDMYGPAFDEPQRFADFKDEIVTLPDADVLRCAKCGQGNTATIRRAN